MSDDYVTIVIAFDRITGKEVDRKTFEGHQGALTEAQAQRFEKAGRGVEIRERVVARPFPAVKAEPT